MENHNVRHARGRHQVTTATPKPSSFSVAPGDGREAGGPNAVV